MLKMERCSFCTSITCREGNSGKCPAHCETCPSHCSIFECSRLSCAARDSSKVPLCSMHCTDGGHPHCNTSNCAGAGGIMGCIHGIVSTATGLACQDCENVTCLPDSSHCPEHCVLARCGHCVTYGCPRIRCEGSRHCQAHCETAHGHCTLEGCEELAIGELCRRHESFSYHKDESTGRPPTKSFHPSPAPS